VQPDQWRTVKTLIDDLLVLPRGARAERLQQPTIDPIVRAEARSLLDEYERGELDDFPRTPRFSPRRRLGAGAFGTVFEAYDVEQQIVVALKILRQTDPASLGRFKREFWTLRELDHPHLVKLYQLFQDDSSWFFTMQLVRGVGFLDHLHNDRARAAGAAGSEGTRNRDELRAVFLQISDGVHALHRSGHIHRDLKPDNVLVNHAGVVTLIDLGMARHLGGAPARQSVSIVGSAHYMSPEQSSGGDLTEATDWYSVGVMLYEALTGAYPFDGTIDEILDGKRTRTPPDAIALSPEIPEDLNALCRDLLQRNAADRPSAADIFRRLGAPVGRRRRTPDSSTAIFVGRDHALTRLDEIFTAVQSSRAGIVVNIAGPSGIGKSTLVREFHNRLSQRRDVLVLQGRCHESARIRFNALDSLVDRLTAHLKTLLALETKALLPRDLAPLVRLFPVLKDVEAIARTRLGPADAADFQELRERGFEALIEILARLGDVQPLVIAIDDIQWGDSDSAAFFARLLEAQAPPAVLWILSYRSEDLTVSPFLARYRRHLALAAGRGGSAQTIDLDLGELSREDAGELIRRLLPSVEMDRVTEAAIIQQASGIPFLIVEFARYAAACSDANQQPHFVLDEVTRARTAALPAAARTLLTIVAVAGQPVPASVAYKAARLESDDFPGLQSLTAENLVRVRETPAGQDLETYHDRFRESIVASLDPNARRQAHLALAASLAEHVRPDPAFVAAQFHGGGDLATAARYYQLAAESSSTTYAFDRAAEFYGLAAELGSHPTEERLRLARLQGEALIYAGRGHDAAAVFASAAREASSLERLELERLAAEQFLRSGNINDGLRLVGTVAKTLGIWIGDRRWQILLSLLWRRALVSAIGPRFRVRPPEAISTNDLAVLDTYWSLAVGLSLVDMTRAGDFSSRHFLKAAWVGEPQRVALSLALQAGHSVIQNGSRGRADIALGRASELAERYGYEHVLAVVEAMSTVCGYLSGEWRHAYQCSVRGEAMLRDERTGVRWEIVSNCIFSLKCLHMMGEWTTFADRLAPLLAEARAKGDRFAVSGFRLLTNSYILDLARDDAAAARATLDEALLEWSQDGFHLQNFWALYGQTESDLYDDASEQALARVRGFWPELSRSLLLRGQVVRILALHLKGRSLIAAAVAIADRNPEAASRLVREARKASKKVARERTAWGAPLASLLDACALLHEGSRRDCTALLESAENGFANADMQHYQAAARWCRGHVSGGEAGAALVTSAQDMLRAQGVVHPEKMFRLMAPGRWN
jgi:serine/threonine protein kinase